LTPRARFEAYVEHILNQVYLGGQTPLPKLFTTPGFTEASARAALEMAERKVMALQRFIKRIVEREIFVPVIAQAGLDPEKANCRLHWGMPDRPKIEVADVIRLAEVSASYGISYVHPEEVRRMLAKMGFELAESESSSVVSVKKEVKRDD
jgi:ketopantoate hydroxymethyltransferase